MYYIVYDNTLQKKKHQESERKQKAGISSVPGLAQLLCEERLDNSIKLTKLY